MDDAGDRTDMKTRPTDIGERGETLCEQTLEGQDQENQDMEVSQDGALVKWRLQSQST